MFMKFASKLDYMAEETNAGNSWVEAMRLNALAWKL